MKQNYQPWTIDINSFPKNARADEQLKFLLNFAILAPSSHNSQPWSFSVKENTIFVCPDDNRSLPQSDTNNRQLYISLGCAITNIIVAADYYGYQVKIDYLPETRCMTRLTFTKTQPKSDSHHLIFSIPKRTNNRNPYEGRMPDQRFQDLMKKLADSELRIDFISDSAIKNQIADIALSAGIEAMDDLGFREELSRYVKSNITKSKIGMPAFGMGIPTPVSLLVPKMIKLFNMNRASRKKDEKLLKKQTPLFVVISTKNDDRLSWLKAGQVYEQIALLALQNNIKTAVWAAPIQIGNYFKELQKSLNIQFRPQVFFRMGYTNKETSHSPRLSLEEVM